MRTPSKYRDHRQGQGQGHFEPCLDLAPGFDGSKREASVEENAPTVKKKTAFYRLEDMMTFLSLIHKKQLCFLSAVKLCLGLTVFSLQKVTCLLA